jgi:hypothetical protein
LTAPWASRSSEVSAPSAAYIERSNIKGKA